MVDSCVWNWYSDMAKKKPGRLHVVSSATGGWVVKKEGVRRASRRFTNQREAITWASEAARKETAGELVVHDRDGMIKKKEAYGADPQPPRG